MKKLISILTLILCFNILSAQNNTKTTDKPIKSVVIIEHKINEPQIVDYISYQEIKTIKTYAVAGYIFLNTMNTLEYLESRKSDSYIYNHKCENNFNYFGTLITSTVLLSGILIYF
jgi:hypothetical protein